MPSYPTRKTQSGTVYDVRFRIVDDTGIEVQKRLCGYPTKKAAQQAYLDFMKTYEPPSFSINLGYSFDELYLLYKQKAEAELAPASFYDLKWIFDKFIISSFTGKTLSQIKKADYSLWQTKLWTEKKDNGEYYSQRYLSKIRTTLMSFLVWIEDTYDIPNLFKFVKKPKRKEIKKEMQIWEIDEFILFQQCIDDIMWRTFFMTLFYSGCRVGEILALSDTDILINDDECSLTISKNIIRKGVSGECSYAVTAPKTASSNRTLSLPAVMRAQLSEYLQYKRDNGIDAAFLFGGDSPLAETTYQRRFAQYIRSAQVKKIRIHDLRHSHASLLIHLNVPIVAISKRLGHSSIDMTLKRYSHCYSDADSATISAINSAVCAINVP